ncbi:MAG: (2,3-dihydroxybenzoyl)adenylate synthase [Streptosporangiaceae bacterium]
MRDGAVPWPPEFAERYAAKGYWLGRPLGDHMWDWAGRYDRRIAIVDGDVRLTYRALAERADALAGRLTARGMRDGDNLVVQLPNTWHFVVLTLACLRLGVAPVMTLLPHRARELTHVARQADATAIAVPDLWRGFDHQALAREVADAAPSVRDVLVLGEDIGDGHLDLDAMCAPDAGDRAPALDTGAPASRDVAVFLLSGGTTGLPKLIGRTHDDYEYNARRSGEVCGFDADTVYLVVLPAAHNFPLACPGILGTLMVGGKIVMQPSPEPEAALAAIARERVTVTAVVPAVAQRWLDAVAAAPDAHDLSSLRVLQVGGARLAPEVGARVRPVLGCTLQQVFGMAEGLLNYTRLGDPEDAIVRTSGRPMSPDDEIRIVDGAGWPVPPGEMGELETRGPYTPRGYFRAPEHNARAFTADGWYRPGDVVRLHPSGNLVVEGRTKDIINRGGEKISAEEVENLMYALPAVAQVAAVGVPDPELSERVCVCVVPRPDQELSLDEIRRALLDRGVAPYKIPERLEFLDALPLTNVGKIDKKALRESLSGSPRSAVGGP